MKRICGIVGIVALAASSACGSGHPELDSATQQGASAEMSDTTNGDLKTLRIGGGMELSEENSIHYSDAKCLAATPYVNTYLEDLEGTQALVKDAAGEVVATPRFTVDHTDTNCRWFLEAEIVAESDFYYVEFLGLSTEIVSVDDAVGGVINIDFSTPITEQALQDAQG